MSVTLKAARVNASMTQEEAAKALNVSKSTLANWENMKSIPTIQKAKEISLLYGIPVDGIIFFKP